MMRKKFDVVRWMMRLAGCGLAAAYLSLPARAQETIDSNVDEVRRYTVEIIIFRYNQDVSTGNERFLPDAPPVPEGRSDEEQGPLVSLPAVEPAPAPEDESSTVRDIELEMLPDDALTMTDIEDRLDRLDVYEPVMHFGWKQTAWPDDETEPLPLSRFGVPPDGLDGTLELYLSRYLHLVVDLALEEPAVVTVTHDDSDRSGRRTFGQMLGYLDEPVDAGPVHYRIQENRILRNGELRYYDHPKFGMLAKVLRVEEEEQPEETELLGYGSE